MNNTPAFPTYERFSAGAGPLDLSSQGMMLRDYFAAKALQSLISGRSWDHIDDHNALMKIWAESAYGVADAMMAARGQQ